MTKRDRRTLIHNVLKILHDHGRTNASHVHFLIRSTFVHTRGILVEMQESGLIKIQMAPWLLNKMSSRHKGRQAKFHVTITGKGRQMLKIMDAQGELLDYHNHIRAGRKRTPRMKKSSL